MYLIPLVLVDLLFCFRFPFVFYVVSFVGAFFERSNIEFYLLICLGYGIIYYQRSVIIQKYRDYVKIFEDTENRLKTSIDKRDHDLKRELQRNNLYLENKVLEEKSRLSQALHDKLGHSINGSVYQLEAAKLLLGSQPEESRFMIQGVIDSLRTSMDEIRLILRKTRPGKRQLAFVQLQLLSEECRDKYGIDMSVNVVGEDASVPEVIWEVILDNSFEAVSNALKYADCTEIKIDIQVAKKMVRCTIYDNGVGCEYVMDGMGINGMRQRIRQLNGIIDFQGSYGFRINMIIPYQRKEIHG